MYSVVYSHARTHTHFRTCFRFFCRSQNATRESGCKYQHISNRIDSRLKYHVISTFQQVWIAPVLYFPKNSCNMLGAWFLQFPRFYSKLTKYIHWRDVRVYHLIASLYTMPSKLYNHYATMIISFIL